MADDCLFEVNERSSFPIRVSFLDENSDPVTPTAATYRLDDELARTNLAPTTSIGSLNTAVDIWITSEQNRIIRTRKAYEVRTLTVEFDYESDNGPAHATAQYKYKLVNLYGVVDVPSASVSPSASSSPSV